MRRLFSLAGLLTLALSVSATPVAAQGSEEPAEEPAEGPAEVNAPGDSDGESTADDSAVDSDNAVESDNGAETSEAAADENAEGEETGGDSEESGTADGTETVDGSEARNPPPVTGPAAERGPKLAVVLVGDPDERLRAWATRVEEALSQRFERPFDPMLRSALRGGLGDPEDGFAEVRRERRRLGLSEAEDVPVLVRLGRRAGAVAIAVVRRGAEGPELVVLDVRHGSFFEGSLVLSDTSPARVRRFVAPRARSASRGAAALPSATVPPAATEPDPEEEGEEDEPDFFERYWPYGAALVLLGAFVAIIAATASTDGGDQPVLRFVPGGR